MILEQAGQALSSAGGIARQDHLLLFAQLGDMVSHRLVDIGVLRPLRRKSRGPSTPKSMTLSLAGWAKGK